MEAVYKIWITNAIFATQCKMITGFLTKTTVTSGTVTNVETLSTSRLQEYPVIWIRTVQFRLL